MIISKKYRKPCINEHSNNLAFVIPLRSAPCKKQLSLNYGGIIPKSIQSRYWIQGMYDDIY